MFDSERQKLDLLSALKEGKPMMLFMETNSKVMFHNITSLWVLSSLSTLCSSCHSYAVGGQLRVERAL